MKGKHFPEDNIEEEKRYPYLIQRLKEINVFFSHEDKERIKEKVFSSLYPKRSLFYKRVLLSTAFIFLLLLPAFSSLLTTKERVKNRHFFFERKSLTQKERVLEKPFTLSPYPYFEEGIKLAKTEKGLEEKEALSEEEESEAGVKEEKSSEEKGEKQEGGGENKDKCSEEKESDGGEEESPSPTPPPHSF
jgi:nucleosome binding factor SPN SPT16 subunit